MIIYKVFCDFIWFDLILYELMGMCLNFFEFIQHNLAYLILVVFVYELILCGMYRAYVFLFDFIGVEWILWDRVFVKLFFMGTEWDLFDLIGVYVLYMILYCVTICYIILFDFIFYWFLLVVLYLRIDWILLDNYLFFKKYIWLYVILTWY